MKKILTAIITILLLSVITLCGCGGPAVLSFSNAFNGGSEIQSGYTEIAEYEVKNVNDATEYPYLTKSDNVDKAIESFNYGGTYKTTFKVLASYPSNLPKSDILGSESIHNGEIYYFKTELSLKVDYTFKNGENKEYSSLDTITTESYFLPSGHSFAPIYCTQNSNMHIIAVGGENAATSKVQYEYITLYNKANYKIDKKISYPDNAEAEPVIDAKTYNYPIKTAIDNTALLFAVRSFATKLEQTSNISVIAPAYGDAKTLGVRHAADLNQDFGFTYNGLSQIDDGDKMPVKKLTFSVNNQNASGMSHYLVIQTGASEKGTAQNKALLVKYVAPIIEYGGMTCLGGLEYSLSSVTIS